MIGLVATYGFLSPWLLLVSLLIPLVLWRYYRRQGVQRIGVPIADASQLEGSVTWRSSLARFLPMLLGLALVSLVIALARPVEHYTEEKVKAEGIDIVLAQDVSGSMMATDFEPNRLEATKKIAQDFIRQRQYDRMGLVVFAGEAFSQSPLTLDHGLLLQYIDQLAFGMIDDGTAIGMGLATAVNRVKDAVSESKVIILLTDGVNSQGYIDPMTAAEIAREYDVRVYTIGVGSEGTAMMPYRQNPDGTFLYRPQKVKIDEALLQQIAKETSGQYFRAKDMSGLQQIYSVIDQLEKTEVEVSVFAREKELFRYPLGVALILLLLFIMLRYFVVNTDLIA